MQYSLKVILNLFIFSLVSINLYAFDAITPFKAEYSLHSYSMKLGVVTRTLEKTANNSYVFSSVSNTTGVAALLRDDKITERSEWIYKKGQILPQFYRYDHSGSKKQRHVSVDFDWVNLNAKNTYKGKTWAIKLEAGVLDKLVYQLALMRDLTAGHIGDIVYKVADGGKLKTYQLVFKGKETIDTNLGSLETYKFTRQSAHKKSRFSTLWCAKKYGWLPVRIEHQEPKGDKVVMIIEKISGLGQ